MAGLEFNKEAKRAVSYNAKLVGKQLGDIADHIALPKSLSSAELLKKLADIPEPQATPPAPERKSLLMLNLHPRWAAAYAAAFVFVAAAFYFASTQRAGRLVDESVVGGSVPLEQAEMAMPEAAAMEEAMPFAAAQQPEMFAADMPGQESGEFSLQSDPPMASRASGASQKESLPDSRNFVGGSGKSYLLKEENGFGLYYRNNDESDPDKPTSSVSVDLVRNEDAQAVCQLNISGMRAVRNMHLFANRLAVVGSSEEGTLLTLYDVADMTAPTELLSQKISGNYNGSIAAGSTVYVATTGSDATAAFGQQPEAVTTLKTTEPENYCAFVAADSGSATPSVSTKVLAGVASIEQLTEQGAEIPMRLPKGEVETVQVVFSGTEMTVVLPESEPN